MVSYGQDVVLKEGDLDQYTVDHDEVVESIFCMLDGTSKATLGLCSRPVQTSGYVSYLRDILQKAAAVYGERSKVKTLPRKRMTGKMTETVVEKMTPYETGDAANASVMIRSFPTML